ncbi:hypothetical protein FAGAP_6264 [Fusarium agapanthi]|uniref:Ankyrin n=1 Tax=Fusarium agapanthi TaxID=1803897 RepID=A0A9P5E6J0_9HYPO|nr:hypothetical protein FAGAP_6264 [Fusarium agapanthi]
MPPPPRPNYKFPYEQFTVDPNQESEARGFRRPYATPMTMTNQDGYQYLTAAPFIIPEASAVFIGKNGVDDDEDCFLNAAQSGCLENASIPLYAIQESRGPYHVQAAPLQVAKLRGQMGPFRGGEVLTRQSTTFLVPPGGERANAAKNEAVMNLLLDRGACASGSVPFWNDKGKLGVTVLTLAVEWASPELVKRLIAGGTDPSTMHDSFNEIPTLFDSCTHANSKVVEALIDCRGTAVAAADILSFRGGRGSIPLHWATQAELPVDFDGSPDLKEIARSIASTIELILSLDPTAFKVQDNDGNTPLHYATMSLSRHNKLYTPVFELLCNKGGDARARNNNGETPLHTLFRLQGDRTTFNDQDPVNTAAISIMFAHGASPTDPDNAGNTPLHLAASNLQWTKAVSYLLERGADPAQENLKKETDLHRAS